MRSSPRKPLCSRGAAAALIALALVLAVAVAGCGGGKEQEDDVGVLLDRASRQAVHSADIELDAELEIEGLEGLERPVRLEATGPYIARAAGLPRLDFEVRVGARGAGQAVEAGILSTGDRAFVEFGGRFYEQPREDVERANRELREQGGEDGARSLRELGLDPRSWVIEAREEGGDEVAGVATRHVSGKLDVRTMLADLEELLQRSSEAVGGLAPGRLGRLSGEDLDRLTSAVGNPSFDLYVARGDGTVRRVSAKLEFVVPEIERARFGGIEGGSLRLSVELADVNGDQRVELPGEPRPIAELATQLGGLDALLAGVGGEPPQQRSGAPPAKQPATPGETTPDPEALQRYSECLDKTPPGDTAGLTRCADLLR